MEEYIVARTRDARRINEPSQDIFLEALVAIPGIEVPENPGIRVHVKYPGTIDELREALGYTSKQVQIEPPIIHKDVPPMPIDLPPDNGNQFPTYLPFEL